MGTARFDILHQISYWMTICYLVFYAIFIVVTILPIPLMCVSIKHLHTARKLFNDGDDNCLIEDAKAAVWGFSAMYISVPIMVAVILAIIYLTGGA